jgi:hypothetical protein
MDKLWKWVMHLNAKAFCLLAILFFSGVAGWCGLSILRPSTPLKDGSEDKLPELVQPWVFGTLDIVSNQLAEETLSIPVDPFRPTIEAIFTNETERAAFLKALKAAQLAAAGGSAESGTAKKEDPFAHLRKKNDAATGGLTGPNGQPMVIPKLTFLGYFERPDGTKATMFHDSVKDTTVFYDTGNQVHGVDLVNADVQAAEIRFPDGTTRKLEIGSSVELAAEADTRPPKKPVAAATKPAQQKPGAKAGLPQKQGQKPAAQPQKQPVRPVNKQERANRPDKANRPQRPEL